MAILYWTGGAGDSDWTSTGNWSTGAFPVTGDDVTIDRTTDDITLNLDQSAVLLDSLTISASFQGTIGNVPDAALEFLQIGATAVTIGDGTGNGSSRLNLDFGTDVTTINIISASSTGTDFPKAPLRINANNSSNVIQVNGQNSTVSFLDNADDTGALGNIDIINGTNIQIGSGATYTSLTMVEGNCISFETSGDVKMGAGTMRLEGSGAISSVIQTGGELIWNSTGTITAYEGIAGILETTDSALARTITTLTSSPGFTFNRNENVIVTNNNLNTNFAEFSISIT